MSLLKETKPTMKKAWSLAWLDGSNVVESPTGSPMDTRSLEDEFVIVEPEVGLTISPKQSVAGEQSQDTDILAQTFHSGDTSDELTEPRTPNERPGLSLMTEKEANAWSQLCNDDAPEAEESSKEAEECKESEEDSEEVERLIVPRETKPPTPTNKRSRSRKSTVLVIHNIKANYPKKVPDSVLNRLKKLGLSSQDFHSTIMGAHFILKNESGSKLPCMFKNRTEQWTSTGAIIGGVSTALIAIPLGAIAIPVGIAGAIGCALTGYTASDVLDHNQNYEHLAMYLANVNRRFHDKNLHWKILKPRAGDISAGLALEKFRHS